MDTWNKGDIRIGFFELLQYKQFEIEEIFFILVSEKYYNGEKIDKSYIRKFNEEQIGLNKYLTFEYLYKELIIKKLDFEAECLLHLIGETI